MKRLSFLFAAAAASIFSATVAYAAPKKAVENDIQIYLIDTYKSEEAVASILAKSMPGKVITGGVEGGTIFISTKAGDANKDLLHTLEKIGPTALERTAVLKTRSEKTLPLSAGQTLELANGSVNDQARTGSLDTGVFMKTTPTVQKNGDIKVAYELRNIELRGIKHAVIAGDKIDLATTRQHAVSGSERLKKGESMILTGFSKDASKGFFGKKNRVIVTVVSPRQL